MILAIDIGNTNIVLGCYDGDKVVFRERVSSTQKATDLEYAVSIKTDTIKSATSKKPSLFFIFASYNVFTYSSIF